MAIPKSTAQASGAVSAYYETTVDFGSIAAGSSGAVSVTLPKKFVPSKPVITQLKVGQADIEDGLVLEPASFSVSSKKLVAKLQLRNETAGAIDPAAKTFVFLQV